MFMIILSIRYIQSKLGLLDLWHGKYADVDLQITQVYGEIRENIHKQGVSTIVHTGQVPLHPWSGSSSVSYLTVRITLLAADGRKQ